MPYFPAAPVDRSASSIYRITGSHKANPDLGNESESKLFGVDEWGILQ